MFHVHLRKGVDDGQIGYLITRYALLTALCYFKIGGRMRQASTLMAHKRA